MEIGQSSSQAFSLHAGQSGQQIRHSGDEAIWISTEPDDETENSCDQQHTNKNRDGNILETALSNYRQD